MKTLVYYISEYGYGHATRSIAIIRELLNRNSSMRIIICNQFALSFLKDSLKEYGDHVIFHEVKTDIGYVLEKGTLELDQTEMNVQYRDYMNSFIDLVNEECLYLQQFSPNGIISDISPLAFTVGKSLRIRSIGISNFTWAGVCKHVLDTDIYSWLSSQYLQADYFYRLAGFREELAVPYQRFGFFSRQVDDEELTRLKREYKIQPEEIVVFISIGMKIDIEKMRDWKLWNSPNCRFIISSNMKLSHPNVITIPNHYTESQNYVGLADVVITKAGWGTVGEAVVNQKKLIIIQRDMEEDRNTLAWLQENYSVEVAEWDELKQRTKIEL